MPIRCPICLNAVQLAQLSDLASLPCGHVFHEECVVHWLRTSATCPKCRVIVKNVRQSVSRLFMDVDAPRDDELNDAHNSKMEMNLMKVNLKTLKRDLAEAHRREDTKDVKIASLKAKMIFLKESLVSADRELKSIIKKMERPQKKVQDMTNETSDRIVPKRPSSSDDPRPCRRPRISVKASTSSNVQITIGTSSTTNRGQSGHDGFGGQVGATRKVSTTKKGVAKKTSFKPHTSKDTMKFMNIDLDCFIDLSDDESN